MPRHLEPGQYKVIDGVLPHSRSSTGGTPGTHQLRTPSAEAGGTPVNPFADGLNLHRGQLVSGLSSGGMMSSWSVVTRRANSSLSPRFPGTIAGTPFARPTPPRGRPAAGRPSGIPRPVRGRKNSCATKPGGCRGCNPPTQAVHRLATAQKRQAKAPSKILLLQKKTHVLRRKLTSNRASDQPIFSTKT